MEIHIYVHDGPSDVADRLDQILARLRALGAQEHTIMADVKDVKQLVADLNDETNSVAAKVDAQAAAIKALKDQIAQGSPVTQADLDEIATALTPISERLKAIGADQANPIPPATA